MKTISEQLNAELMLKMCLTSLFLILIQGELLAQVADTVRISDDLMAVRVTDHVYVHISYSEAPGYGRFPSNGMIYEESGKAYLFDTPVSEALTEVLVDWIQDFLKLEIAGFVPNHWHDDCMGGLSYLKHKGIKSFANEMTIDLAREKGLPVPETGFRDSLSLIPGSGKILCYYPGPAHSSDNIVVWLQDEKVLFAGCMVKEPAWGMGNLSDADLKAWPATLEKVMRQFPDARIVIPGHGRIGGMELILHTIDLLANP